MGIMEKKMETAIEGLGFIRQLQPTQANMIPVNMRGIFIIWVVAKTRIPFWYP